MSLFVASLNSGSNGNCYYIGNNEEAVLVDAGISCREIEKRLKQLALAPEKIKAVFISHEHTDHISGLQSLVKKLRVPVYITQNTQRAGGLLLEEQFIRSFNAFEPVQVGSLAVTAFPKWHDAADPHSFIISCNGVTTGIFTDIGEPCKNVVHYFKQCHACFLESNYDEQMLANSRYPVFLRNRISSRQGHLSNAQALRLFTEHRPAFMTHLFLSHLSRENNDPALAIALFTKAASGVSVVHAPRTGTTAVYRIVPGEQSIPVPSSLPFLRPPVKKAGKSKAQLSLF